MPSVKRTNLTVVDQQIDKFREKQLLHFVSNEDAKCSPLPKNKSLSKIKETRTLKTLKDSTILCSS